MDKLLLEIGTEEIPAGYIEPALSAMSKDLDEKLTAARIDHGCVGVFGTPRKLAVMVHDVAPKQHSLTEEVVGPPEKVGFDDSGKPTMAAQKFAEKVGIAVSRLKVKQLPKGRYLCARKTERGLAARTLLKTMLPEVITGIVFPKRMKWGTLDVMFARPIRSIMALYGRQVVSFSVGDVKSGRYTHGHYFMYPGKIKIDHPDQYVSRLNDASVMVDIKLRKDAVKKKIDEAAASAGGSILPDDALLDLVTHLVEYPAPVVGRFDTEFLDLPPEVLITAMREHQKYFAIVDSSGKLMPRFVAVNNTVARDMDLVANGHGRVIRARLADAQFFYNSDTSVSMETWVEKLKGVTFQARLGTVHDKVKRVQQLAEILADEVLDNDSGSQAPPALKAYVSRAALLSKADLVSEVVGEFPKLQGVMGRVYAEKAGEPPELSQAIEEHYRPTHSGGALPETITGAVVGIADKLDSICGFFSVGLVPTGASDPYALRRQGIGIVQIMNANEFNFSLNNAVHQSLRLYNIPAGKTDEKQPSVADQVLRFLRNRMNRMLTETGYAKDVVQAVTHVSVDRVPNVWRRVRALETLKAKADFGALAGTFKRVGNIIRKAGDDKPDSVTEALFEEKSESALHRACQEATRLVSERLDNRDFDGALLKVAALKEPVDTFFDDVMVMAEDQALRNNRLALLRQVADLFDQFADFSKIAS
ncbi:MAG: glycine--tRNA ligase subunit beta [Deltaproteobacteria bacterium]|nr:MAG: glycine--tRNA ligase subunit beta [Deltaproteobacteria bacterium]